MYKLPRNRISTVIYAAGSYDNKKNKFQHNITFKNKSLVDRNISLLKRHKFADIHVVLGYNLEYNRAKNVHYHINNEFNIKSNIYSILIGIKHCLNKNIILLPGDILFDSSLFQTFTYGQTETVFNQINTIIKKN